MKEKEKKKESDKYAAYALRRVLIWLGPVLRTAPY